MKQLIIERWQGFSQKEQRFLGVFGCTLLIFFLYAYLWLPIQQASDRVDKVIPKKEAQLNLMKIQAAEIESRRNQFHLSKASKEGLKTSIEHSAINYGIVLEKLSDQSDSSGTSLKVQIASTSFDAWIKWTEGLQVNQGIRVTSCVISPDLKPGEVKVDAVFGTQN